MRTLLRGFIGGIILWAVIYGLVNYVALPSEYHDALLRLLIVPADIIIFLAKFLRDKVGIAIVEPDWFFIQPISWGVAGALVSLAIRIIRF